MTEHRGGEPASPAPQAEGAGTLPAAQPAPLPLVWTRIHRTAWSITCAHCHTELVQATDLSDGLRLAARNATARPCCPAWVDLTPNPKPPTSAGPA